MKFAILLSAVANRVLPSTHPRPLGPTDMLTRAPRRTAAVIRFRPAPSVAFPIAALLAAMMFPVLLGALSAQATTTFRAFPPLASRLAFPLGQAQVPVQDQMPVQAQVPVQAKGKAQTPTPPPTPAPRTMILPGETFVVAGRTAFVFPPAKPRRPQPWVLYAPTLPPLPDSHEKWMHERFTEAGIAVAGIDVGEAYGSPEGQRLFSELHRELVERRGFAAKPVVLGRSRGGLLVTAWAGANPDKVAGLAGIYPVFDFRSYPGLANAARAYGLTAEELDARRAELNPIERAERLARAKVPAFLIHGDVDRVVPLRENSGEFAARYKAAGGEALVQLVVPEGQGHNYWPGFFRCQELVDFVIAQATKAAPQ